MSIAFRMFLSECASVYFGVDHNRSDPHHAFRALLPSPMLMFRPRGQLRRYFGRSSCILIAIDRCHLCNADRFFLAPVDAITRADSATYAS